MPPRPLPFLLASLGMLSACAAGKVDLPENDSSGAVSEDADGDGFPAGADCDDSDAARHPGADEVCDGLDNDCDGVVDPDTSLDAGSWYPDEDGDGYGRLGADPVTSCHALAGYESDATDCQDADAEIHPGATEVCNGEDDDCDGVTDPEISADASTWYADTDDDGYGDPSTATTACEAPAGTIAEAGDCDDSDPGVNPGATEVCDAGDVDEDCDGLADDADPSATGKGSWYLDADADGYGAEDATAVAACDAPIGYADNAEDCDDGDASRSPVGWPCTSHLYTSDAAAKLTGVLTGDSAGFSVWGGDDYNLDGTPDYLVGAYPLSGETGSVYVKFGPLDSRASLVYADLTFAGTSSWDLGYWTGPAGDLDGDGHADLAFVGTKGGYYAFYTPVATGLTLSDADVQRSAEASGGAVGGATGGLDMNGDGQDDGVVANNNWTAPSTYSGSIYVLFGPLSGSASLGTADLILNGETAGDDAGDYHGLARGGDMDGDGLDDLLVGALLGDEGGTNAGSAYVVLGGSSGVGSLADADAIVRGTIVGQFIGEAVAGDGDADGDGYDDLLIGSGWNMGAVWLISGPLDGTLTISSATASLLGASMNDEVGGTLGQLTDLDADGQDDVVVGALQDLTCAGVTAPGSVYVFYGPLSGTLGCDDANVILTGETAFGRLSQSIATVGDVDGDGLGDLFVGAYYESAGNAYLFSGSAF